MAERGWYPDPGGEPGRFRYWNGTSWSAGTADHPQQAPPDGPKAGGRRRGSWWLAAGAIVLVLIMIVTLVVLVRRTGVLGADVQPPQSTRSSWDDSSPTAKSPTPTTTQTASPPPKDESASPDSSGTTPSAVAPRTPRPGDCGKEGTPDDYAKQPDPQRISGGGLSFEKHGDPWTPVVTNEFAVWMTWATDVGGEMEVIRPGHNALLFVGGVRPVHEKKETPRKAAERLTLCEIQSFKTQGLTVKGAQTLVSRAVTVDGHQGWSVRTQVAVDDLQNNAEGDLIEFTVVDTGKELSFFFGEIPYPDPARIAVMDRTIETILTS